MFLSLLAAIHVAIAPVPPRPMDQFGDSLPTGAIARLGTVRFRAANSIERVVINKDGTLLLTGSDKGLDLWDGRTGRLLRVIEFLSVPDPDDPSRKIPERFTAIEFSSDSRKIHVLTGEGLLRAFDLDGNRWSEPLAQTKRKASNRFGPFGVWGQASPDGTHFASIRDRDAGPDDPITPGVEVLALGKAEPMLALEGKEFAEPGGLVRFTRDNKLLAVRLNDGSIKIREIASGRLTATLSRLDMQLSNFDFTPDGKTLVACYTAEVRLRLQGPVLTLVTWDVATGKERSRREKWEGYIGGFTRDGKRLISVTRGAIVVTDTETWQPVARLAGHQPGAAPVFALSADSSRLVTAGGRDGSMILWDLEACKPALDFDAPRGRMGVLAFSPDGQTVLSGTEQGQTCWLWDARSGKRKHTLQVPGWGQTSCAIFTPDGGSVLIGSASGGTGAGADWKARQWNARDGKLVREFTGHESGVQRIAVSPDGKRMATHETGKTVRTWDLETGKLHREIEWPVHWQYAGFAYSQAGELIGVARLNRAKDTTAMDLLAGKALATWVTEGRSSVHGLSPDTRLVATIEEHRDPRRGPDDHWTIRDRTTGTVVSRLPIEELSYLHPVAFSHDNTKIAVTVGRREHTSIHLYDVKSGNRIRTIAGHACQVASLAFSPDGKTLASGAWDSTVLIWDLTSKP